MIKKPLFLSMLTGILLSFSHPNFFMRGIGFHSGFLIWAAFIPLFCAAHKGNSPKKMFLYAMLSGVIFYSQGLYWLIYVKEMGGAQWAAWAALAFYCSLFLAVPVLLGVFLKKRYNLSLLFSLPAALAVFEFIRVWFLTGFPLLTPAQSQSGYIPVLKVLKITGAPGLNYLIYFINAAAAGIIINKKIDFRKRESMAALAAAVFVVFLAVFSNTGGSGKPEKFGVAILQPNIKQNVTWDSSYKKNTFDTFKKLALSVKHKNPSLYVWPETGYPGALNLEPEKAAEIASWVPEKKEWHLIGSDRIVYNGLKPRAYNSAFMVSPSGEITGDYGKTHLVPFGEYIPFNNVVPFVTEVVNRYDYMGWTPGEEIRPLRCGDKKAGVLICYEMLFPGISRKMVKKGADFLVNISYETWYGDSPASAQLFANTVLRAVENGVPLVRCVAGGISGFVESGGKISFSMGLFEKGASFREIKLDKKRAHTFYTRFGDWFIYFLVLLAAALAVWGKMQPAGSAKK